MADQWELETLASVNKIRIELGLPILEWSKKLESAARNYWTNPSLSQNVIKTCNCPHWTPPNQIANLLWCDELGQYSNKFAAIVIFNDEMTHAALALNGELNMMKILKPKEPYHETLPDHRWHNDLTWEKVPNWIKENSKYRSMLFRGKRVTGKNVSYHLVHGKLMRQLRINITPINGRDNKNNQPKKSSMVKTELSVWNEIEKQFGDSKKSFGKKINFVTNIYKRKIIFRDIADAYALASAGYSKPAVILAGSVIEELLRLYLDEKGISPISPLKSDFNGYIQTCIQNKLLKDSVSHLSDSVRGFRNLVHLSAETTKKQTISRAEANIAVASIFTIVKSF